MCNLMPACKSQGFCGREDKRRDGGRLPEVPTFAHAFGKSLIELDLGALSEAKGLPV